jgi:transient receptor potential cation channel subfamily M protein 3
VDSIYWYLRILNILGVNKYLGPLVTMMGKMVKNMIYFVVLLAVVLMSFGVCRQAILFPDQEPNWRLAREIYYQPYFMLYGEVFADDIDPPCGEDPSQKPCAPGHWVTPIAMSMYLLVANILLINLLIAVFNNIFNEVNSVSHQVWMFQRFTVVMEYQQKPVLPPPLIALCHFYSLCRTLFRKAKGLQESRDNGLKLFLEKEDMERLYDFEEECVEGYFREQEAIIQQSTEERIRNTDERVENMSQKIEDINQKENAQNTNIQNIEFRLRKVEESSEQILHRLDVIHRFMAAHTFLEDMQRSVENIEALPRTRAVSESEGTSHFHPRRKFLRSLTEVRPDAYIFDDGLHFEVRTVPEESEHDHSPDALDHLARDRKMSVQSEDFEMFIPPPPQGAPPPLQSAPSSAPPVMSDQQSKKPFLNVRNDTTNSSESKDTLTPLENDDNKTLVGENDVVEPNFDGLRQRAIKRRNSAMGRRYSETCSNIDVHKVLDVNRSQTSLNQLSHAKRQLSLTQSEPDSGNDAGE